MVAMGYSSGASGGRLRLVGKLAALPWGLAFLITAVAMLGTGMLYSVTHGNAGEASLHMAHLIRFAIGFAVMIALALVPIRVWGGLAYPVYFATLALLFAVELSGAVRGGAQRWLEIGPVAVQPSEFMKLALILALARYYHAVLKEEDRYRRFWIHIPALALIAAPAALIFMQPDFGTTLALIASGGIIVFLAGLNWKVILTAMLMAGASVVPIYHYVLQDYQRERVDTFLEQLGGGEPADSLGDSYQIEQAKIAIGSGGFRGKGYLEGTQSQLDYIPEQHTDFILTVIAEELGFVGTTSLMLVWGVILGWGFYIATRSASEFGKFAAAGAVGIIGFYILFNVGMVLGLLPVVGVPMPLVSYGGTAMMTVMTAFGLILSVHIHRKEPFTPRGVF